MSTDGPPRVRRDAARNRERLLDAALGLYHEHGEKVSSLAITEAAGLAAGTLYRHFPTRADLTTALAHRSYRIALEHARAAADAEADVIDALRGFLERTIDRRAELMLPLHGAPVTNDAESVRLREEVSTALDRLLERGRRAGALRGDVGAIDIVLMGALLAQPLPHVPDWGSVARRQAGIYLDGLRPAAVTGRRPLPGVPPGRAELERALTAPESRDRR